jgi:hypothetical protein
MTECAILLQAQLSPDVERNIRQRPFKMPIFSKLSEILLTRIVPQNTSFISGNPIAGHPVCVHIWIRIYYSDLLICYSV